MRYNLTAKDILVLGQKTKSYLIKIELLNNNFQLLDIIEGNCLSCSLDIDSSADIRRTVTLTMLIRDPKDLVSPTSKIWVNRYLRIYLGIQYIRTKEILWYPLILCVPSEDTYTYDINTRILQVKCVDFMSALINTPLYGTTTHIIPAGSNIRSALIAALKLANVKKYNICEISNITDSSANTVPYDISMDSSSSVYDLVKKLLTLYAGYEIFADLDTIVVQRVPTTIEDGIVLSDDILKSKGLIISESISNSLNIKNVTEIFGKQIKTDYYSESVTLNGSQYNATVDGLSGLVDGMQIALKLPSANPVNAMIKINSLTAYPITDSADVALQSNSINGYNVFRFHNNCFEYLGQYQIHGICMLVSKEPTNEAKAYYQQYFNCDNIFYRVSPNNDFTIEKLATSSENYWIDGARIDTKSGNDYDVIYSQELAIERAKYENWKSSRLNRTLSLTTQTIPFLDVNQKFTYKSKIDNVLRQWIITKISFDNVVSGTMNLEATEFFETYPETYE